MNKIIIALATVSTISTTAAIVLGVKLKKSDEALENAYEAYDKLYEEYSNDVEDYGKLENNYGRFINILCKIDKEAYREVVKAMANEKSSEETEAET